MAMQTAVELMTIHATIPVDGSVYRNSHFPAKWADDIQVMKNSAITFDHVLLIKNNQQHHGDNQTSEFDKRILKPLPGQKRLIQNPNKQSEQLVNQVSEQINRSFE
ncbi:MAG TPA: hypothetical protein PLD20_06950 [Blastocatellia bacterium]|nr:hypothetical protein [Blastocatellia bacterium]HMX26788.1 hypothetical protein [Blastocatellia bacterium]HMZ17647.1 hypothetical protein [Blastocatellia bacterium]HNG29312.1 hypothetical protein [Blastocatellia bacterium]